MRVDESHLHSHPEGYDYWPSEPGDNTLGWVGAIPGIIGSIGGLFGGRKLWTAQALAPGGAAPGRFNEADVQAALKRAPASTVEAVRRTLLVHYSLDPNRGAPFQWDPEHVALARAAVFCAHRGIGDRDAATIRALDALMQQYGTPAPPSGTGYQGVVPAIPPWLADLYEGWEAEGKPPPVPAPQAAGVAGMGAKSLLLLAGVGLAAAKVFRII